MRVADATAEGGTGDAGGGEEGHVPPARPQFFSTATLAPVDTSALRYKYDAAFSSDTRLELRGVDGRSRVVTSADLARFPRREIAASAHRVTGRYAGVALGDVLGLVGRATGDSLRGERLADYALVEAADGYRVVFALAELDTSFTDRTVLLADQKDGAPLVGSEGPLRLVVPGERRPARWVRQVTRISILAAPPTGPLTTTQPR